MQHMSKPMIVVMMGRLKLQDWTLYDRFGRDGQWRTTYGLA